jgi:hypothetical protein
MRDLAKMAELKFEAPLAQFEDGDEWGPVDYQSSLTQEQQQQANLKAAISDSLNLNNLKESLLVIDNNLNNNNIDNIKLNATATNASNLNNNNLDKILTKDNIDNFNETFSGSLEDLVHSFDDKITKCFGYENYEQSVEELAPVQVRSQEEIMNECQ